MATTSRGYPYPALTDQPNGPTQLQALAQAVNDDVAGTVRACCRMVSGSAGFGVATFTQYPIPSWSATTTNVGDIAYSGGVFTPGTTGLYSWSLTAAWPNPGATYQRTQLLRVDGGAVQNGRVDFEVSSLTFNTGTQYLTAGGPVYLNAGDDVQPTLFHTGATQSVTPLFFALWRIG